MRHLLHTFGDLPIGATFWFDAKRTTVRGASYKQRRGPYVKVSERKYRDLEDVAGKFLYEQTRRDARVGGMPPANDDNRARVSTKTVDFGNGIRVVYLPVNQAWIVMWMDQIVRGPIPHHEAMAEAAQITGTSLSETSPPHHIGRLAHATMRTGRNRSGSPPISREEHDDIMRRERAYEAARERFDPRRYKRGGGYAPEEITQIERVAGEPAPTNEERALADQYEWIVDVPERAFLYYDMDKAVVTGFMGDVRGEIVWRGVVQRRLGGKTQAIRVHATNGATYHGIANLTGGNYVRLRLAKAEARALKKLEKFIP